MHYLALLVLSLAECRKMRLTDDYSIHRLVMGMFRFERSRDRILYADNGVKDARRRILVLSAHAPEPPDFGTLEIKKFHDTYLEKEAYRFKIIINTQKRKPDNVFIPILSKQEIREWFVLKATQWGFEPFNVDVINVRKSKFHKPSGTLVTLAKAHLNGALIVKDRELFIHSFYTGLGRGKAFGCGLLQLQSL